MVGPNCTPKFVDRGSMAQTPKRATLTREQLGIVDEAKDIFETADMPEASGDTQQLRRELESARRQQRDERPAQPAPIDRAPLEPGAARSFFQTLDAVSQPPDSDFSQQAHERKREEWRILGSRQRSLETPFDRYTRLLAETQALQRLRTRRGRACVCARMARFRTLSAFEQRAKAV